MVTLSSFRSIIRERHCIPAHWQTAVFSLIFLVLMLCPSGAAGGDIVFAVHPELDAELPEAPRLGFLRPDIEIHQVSAGGVTEKIQDWCDTACANVRVAMEELFGEKVKFIPIEQFESGSSIGEEVLEVEALYKMVSGTIVLTWAGSLPFPKEYRIFDYSVGDISNILDTLDVDALVLITGYDQVKTGGRQAMEVFALLAAGAVYTKAAYIDVALVGRSGKLLWYRFMGSLPKTDLREPEGARAYVTRLLKDFPVK